MHERDRIEHFTQNGFNIFRRQLECTILDHIQKVAAFNEIERHVGGVVFLKNLVHANNVGMIKLGHATRFLNKQAHDRSKFRLVRAAARCNQRG